FSQKNIRDYAQKRGWYDSQKKEPFDFAYSYMRVPSPEGKLVNRGYDTRQWRAQQLITGQMVSVEEAKQNGLPFAVTPKEKMTVSDVMEIFRDHYEGTIYGPVARNVLPGIAHRMVGAMPRKYVINPNYTQERTICTITTIFSTIVQYSPNLPEEIGSILWTCFGRPDFNVYVPWYGCIKDIPEEYFNTPGIDDPDTALQHHFDPVPGTFDYDPSAAYWIINDLENLADAHYLQASELILPVFSEFENYQFHMQKYIENTARSLYKQDPDLAKDYLTEYTKSRVGMSLRMTQELTKRIKTKYYH
ncbi:MAG: C69 family dipeptidase, partial [bacterium]